MGVEQVVRCDCASSLVLVWCAKDDDGWPGALAAWGSSPEVSPVTCVPSHPRSRGPAGLFRYHFLTFMHVHLYVMFPQTERVFMSIILTYRHRWNVFMM